MFIYFLILTFRVWIKRNLILLFSLCKILWKTEKLCEFNLHWDYVYKVNKWCLVDYFLCKLKSFFSNNGIFSGPLGHFLKRFKICVLIPTLFLKMSLYVFCSTFIVFSMTVLGHVTTAVSADSGCLHHLRRNSLWQCQWLEPIAIVVKSSVLYVAGHSFCLNVMSFISILTWVFIKPAKFLPKSTLKWNNDLQST